MYEARERQAAMVRLRWDSDLSPRDMSLWVPTAESRVPGAPTLG